MRATVIVPFIGSILLFNKEIVELLSLSPRIVRQLLDLPPQGADAMVAGFSLWRLYFTYFGLSLLGIGSFLFIVLCPSEIKSFPSAHDFIASETPLYTRSRGRVLLGKVVADYLAFWGEGTRLPYRYRLLGYPNELSDQFESVIDGIYRSEVSADVEDTDNRYLSMTDTVNIDAVVEAISARRRFERVIWESFAKATKEYQLDLLTIRYGALQFHSPISRAFVASLYVLGFATLSAPTIHTFLLILGQARRAWLG